MLALRKGLDPGVAQVAPAASSAQAQQPSVPTPPIRLQADPGCSVTGDDKKDLSSCLSPSSPAALFP